MFNNVFIDCKLAIGERLIYRGLSGNTANDPAELGFLMAKRNLALFKCLF